MPTVAVDLDDEPPAGEVEPPEAGSAKKPGYHTENFRIRPSLSISERYDSNIYAVDSDTDSDFITVTSPQIKIDSTWEKHSLKFKAGADFGRYWEFDAENYLDYWASTEGRFNLSETTDLFGGMGLSFEHEGRDSPDANSTAIAPTTYWSHNAHLGAKTVIGDTTLRLGGTYEILNFDNDRSPSGPLINDDRDRDLFGLGIRASHELDERSEIFIQALYDERTYDLDRDQNGYRRDSEGYRAALGLKNDFGGGNKTEAYIGIISQDYDDDRFDTVNEMDFGGRLTLQPAPATKVTANLQRSLNETTDAGSPGYINTSLSGRIEHRLSARLIPHLSFGYDFADYLQTGLEDKTYYAEAGLKYFVARNAYIVTGVTHSARDSNDAGLASGSYDYEKSTLFLTFATQGYPLFEPMISDMATEGEIEFGALFLFDDAQRFGRYNGLTDEGLTWNGRVEMHSTDGMRDYANISGLDLGLDSRSLRIEWGSQGSYEAFVDYDQLPFSDFAGQTIFTGVGGKHLALPGGWVTADTTGNMTQLDSSLSEVDIGTVRKRLGVGTALYSTEDDWTVTLGYQTETKEGIDQVAGVIGTSPGNARSAMLPAPIDYTTNILNASLGYLSGRTQIEFGYMGSFFYDNLESLSWESPFDSTGSRGTEGATSLPPDNQFHQFSVSGGHSLSDTTRLTAVASVGAMLQDQDFQPDTVAPGLVPNTLPRNSLDGEIYLYNALLAVSSRPSPGLNLKASYRLQKRDNQTPSDTYTYFINDSGGAGSGSPATSTNTPYSYDRRTMQLDAGYRINGTARLSGELARDTMERSPSEVNKTTEDKGRVKLQLTLSDTVQLSVSGGMASRSGSHYETIAGENPLLRKYNISDRDRVSGGLDVSYTPTEQLSFSANVEVSDDDYDATEVGLTEAKQTTAILDASYRVSEDLSGHAYVGREWFESHQAGSQVPDTPDWFVENDDTVDSLGLGLKWRRNSRWEFGADYVLSRSTGETSIRSNNALPPATPYPDLRADLHSLRLYADYAWDRNTKVKLGYQYEKYDADEWSTDGVGADSISEVLLLDEDNPSYQQHVVGLSVVTRF